MYLFFIILSRVRSKRDLLEWRELPRLRRFDISPFGKDGVSEVLKTCQLHCPMFAVKDKDVAIGHTHYLFSAHNRNGLLRESLSPLLTFMAGLGVAIA